MASIPKPLGSYLWDKAKDGGNLVWDGAEKAGADIGNTFQSVLYGGWSTQAAHNTSMRMAKDHALEEDNKRIEPERELNQDGPEKE